MLTSRLDAYILRYCDFCANDNTTDYFSPCACVGGGGGNNKPNHLYIYMAHPIVANQAVADYLIY